MKWIPDWLSGWPAIVASNMVALALAVLFNWGVLQLALLYWCHSMVIGALNVRRMRALKQFSTKGFTSNGKAILETEAGKRSTVNFFIFHFGSFQAFYVFFLYASQDSSTIASLGVVLLNLCLFTWHEWERNSQTIADDEHRKPNLGVLMLLPYLRVVPMHLFILASAAIGMETFGALMLFIMLKTGSDVLFELLEAKVNDA